MREQETGAPDLRIRRSGQEQFRTLNVAGSVRILREPYWAGLLRDEKLQLARFLRCSAR